jgi:hypothetical protein
MKKLLLVPAVLALVAGAAPQAEARGCIKGAIVGGVAGHYIAGRGGMGALAGCLGGRALANRRANRESGYGRRGGSYRGDGYRSY